MKILIIGGGNMGETYAQSFLSAHIIRPQDLTILEHNSGRIAYYQNRQPKLGKIMTAPSAEIGDADLIVLAVKPQDSSNLHREIQPFLRPEQLVLSIMAGVRLNTLSEQLGIQKIVRAMPNLPSQVGMGMTAFTATPQVERNELISVQNLLSTTGRAIYFDDEAMIDASTAISGSGPAYVYYFMQAMIDAAMRLGFKESEADLLVWQTFTGAIDLQNKYDLSCQEWIKRVASKGGTTEAALKIFEKHQLDEHIKEGIHAAFLRAMELGAK